MPDDLAGEYIERKEDRKLGFGYNKFTAGPSASPAVVGTVGQPREGQGVASGIDSITEVSELHQSFGVDVDVSASYLTASASAKMKYTREFDSSTYSMYVVIWVRVDDSFQQFDEPVLHQDATELLKTRNSTRFHERFGDYWISGVSYGGEFFATYQITATSEEQREEMAAQVHAAFNGVITSAELNVSIDAKSKDSHNRVEVRLVEFRQGAVTHADLDLEAVKETARAFPQLVREKPYPYRVKLEAYEALRLPTDDFDFYQNQKQSDVLADLARKRLEFLKLRDDIRYILANPQDFMNVDGSEVGKPELTKTYNDVVDQLNSLATDASACSRDASACRFTQAEVAKYVLPVPRPRDNIAVVSLVGLRAHAIMVAAADRPRDYPSFRAEALAAEEGDSRGIVVTEEQYRFLHSGIKVKFDKTPPNPSGYTAYHQWVIGQKPDRGTVGSGAEILLTVKIGSNVPPG
ncbi:hypothetical protein ACTOB_003289 [Actinoplanes oblitus]|uniref:MACPF domain-containing protein n=1 Tax=Actinoplanes oblitus TaxID=3040509 RepID=A0ABY8WTI7_9ACTN|nr:hypothetical protein [Actinoplanes oblitus]WIM99629.1 hypothetical protein ACTOB_003289 [Actinoplanes oblitus]